MYLSDNQNYHNGLPHHSFMMAARRQLLYIPLIMVGLTIQNNLFSIILNFSKHNFVLSANITKMYVSSGVYIFTAKVFRKKYFDVSIQMTIYQFTFLIQLHMTYPVMLFQQFDVYTKLQTFIKVITGVIHLLNRKKNSFVIENSCTIWFLTQPILFLYKQVFCNAAETDYG